MRSINTLLLFLFCGAALGQSEELDLEKITPANQFLEEGEFASEELNALLLDLISEPLDLNSVTENILQGISFLSRNQVKSFIEYRSINGPLNSIWELQVIEEWDIETCKMLQDFVVVYPKSSGKRFKNFGRNSEILLRQSRVLQSRKGFEDSTGFIGSRNKWQIRIKSSYPGKYLVALAMENDPGESFQLSNSQIGFDHLSGNFSVFNLGKIKKATLGDFRIQFGQGIMYGGAFGGRKGSDPIISIPKANIGIIPSASFGEFGFKRGVAITFGTEKYSFTPFASYIKQDARLTYDSIKQTTYFSSFNTTGLHRNHKELASKNNLTVSEVGGILTINRNLFTIGSSFNLGKYSTPLILDDKPYQRFRFQGKKYSSFGFFFDYRWQNVFMFSESVISNFNDIANISGAIFSISKKIDLSLVYRHYSPGFYSPGGKSFAETSTQSNESGIIWGIKYLLSRRIQTTAYFDYFRFPWLQFQSHSPSDGYEYLIRLDYLSKHAPLFISIKREVKDQGLKVGSLNSAYCGLNKTLIILDGRFTLSKNISTSIRSAVTYAKVDNIRSSGFLLKQDLRISRNSHYITFGYSLFDTSGYDARLYARESDVRFQSTFPLFYGKGIRYFILPRIKLERKLSIWIKYYLTSYDDRKEIGSGSDLIAGNKISELKFQLMYSLN